MESLPPLELKVNSIIDKEARSEMEAGSEMKVKFSIIGKEAGSEMKVKTQLSIISDKEAKMLWKSIKRHKKGQRKTKSKWLFIKTRLCN